MLETGISDGGFALAALIALFAGVLSFISPCVLPIVPPYLAYMGGITMSQMDGDDRGARGRALIAALFFVLGLSTIFLFLGFTASAFSHFFLQYRDRLAMASGLVIMVFGAHFLGVIRIGLLNREARIDAGNRGGSAFGAYVLGLAFAFGWTPCIGPQLGMILTLAAQTDTLGRGAGLLAIYALGLGLPFLLVAAFFPRLKGAMGFLKRHMDRIERIMGLLLWTIGLLMVTGEFSQFSFWLLETFPTLGQIG